jgi:hypothetical protein
MRRLAFALALLPALAFGQPQPNPGPSPLSPDAAFATTGTPTPRTRADRAGDRLNPRDYGAIGDGASHTANAVLGITTLAGLTGYTAPNGSHPYSWAGSYPYGTLFNLPVAAVSAPSATTLTFQVAATEGVTINTNGSTASGTNIISMQPYAFTAGDTVTGLNIPGGTTTVTNFGGSLQVSNNTSGIIPTATGLVIGAGSPVITTASNTFILTLASNATAGDTTLTITDSFSPGAITASASVLGTNAPMGQQMTGANLGSGVTVSSVSGSVLTLNKGIAGNMLAGQTISLQSNAPTGATRVYLNWVAGMDRVPSGTPLTSTVGGAVPASTNIASIASYGTSGAVVTLTGALTAQVTAFAAMTVNSSFALNVTDVVGIAQGDIVTAAGAIQSGTYVEYVNPSTLEVKLNKGTAGRVAGGTSVTFTRPWLDRIVAGVTQVSGPCITGSVTVSTVNTSTGVVTLPSGTASACNPATGWLAATPQARGTPITFYSPFTDAQAQALQMDALGIIGAEQAAEPGSGTVTIPSGTYRMDQTVIMPVVAHTVSARSGVKIIGDGERGTNLVVYADLGPSRAVLSCGDPTADYQNLRGIYAVQGSYCWGSWDRLNITTNGYTTSRGARPAISGVPVLMDGVKQGPRRNMRDVEITGFNNGILFQGDHTIWDHVTAKSNFNGMRYDSAMTILYGDQHLNNVWFYGNSWAGLSVAPNTYFEGEMLKPYFGFNAYAVWCEPGLPNIANCMQGTSIIQPNWESVGCAAMADGNELPNLSTAQGSRGISDTTFENLFTSNDTTFSSFQLPGGCAFNGYFTIYGAYGLTIRSVWSNAFPVTAGPIVRAHRTGNFAQNAGGLKLSGAGFKTILANYGAAGIELVNGAGALNSDFYNTRSYDGVEIEVPGFWRARMAPFIDSGQTTFPLGMALESKVGGNSGIVAARAGTATAGTMVPLGVNLQPAAGFNWNNKMAVIGVAGSELPISVGAARAAGVLLKVDATATGLGVVGTSVTDGQLLGIVSDANSGSTSQVFMRTPGQ